MQQQNLDQQIACRSRWQQLQARKAADLTHKQQSRCRWWACATLSTHSPLSRPACRLRCALHVLLDNSALPQHSCMLRIIIPQQHACERSDSTAFTAVLPQLNEQTPCSSAAWVCACLCPVS